MSSTSTTTGKHPVAEFDARLEQRLDGLAAVAVWPMSDAELRETLVGLTRSISRVEALRLQVLAEADRREATALDGAANSAVFVAVATKQTRRTAKADLKLARALDDHQTSQRR